MKKSLLSLAALLMAGTALAQVNFTFNLSNTGATVNVAKDGETATGVTATIAIEKPNDNATALVPATYLAATGNTAQSTTVADAPDKDNVLCINKNTTAGTNTFPNKYTLTVTNESGQAITFDQFRVSGVAMNSVGDYQPLDTPRKRFFKIGYGTKETAWTEKWICDNNGHHSGKNVNNLFDLEETQTIPAGATYVFTVSISNEGVAATNKWNQGCFWGITEISLVNTHTLSVGESGYATLMLGYNATIPAGATCYAAAVEGDKAKLTAIGGALAANTPVLVQAAEGDYVFEPVDYASAVEGNELLGTLSAKSITPESGTTCYVLAKPDEQEIGFYRVTLTDGSFLNNANKAYLPVTAAAAARFISFDFGTETGIDELKAENGNLKTETFDLAGRRVQGAQKGIFIVNGKKVIR
jgi:hypothetical protein